MKTKFVLTLFMLNAALIMSSFKASESQRGRWEHLGSRTVNYSLDKDVIPVGAKEGVYTQLKLVVSGGSLNMHRMVVEYGNGERDEIELRHQFGRGSTSRVIDLRGNRRIIRSVHFWYDSKNLSRQRARISLFGAR